MRPPFVGDQASKNVLEGPHTLTKRMSVFVGKYENAMAYLYCTIATQYGT